ncbi:RNA-directed DNA polymerase [Moorena sp. SIO3H5]|uniref:RNA-directed DNA polymerase n=1 Tax=Moorena sp. SIO3H5 TaxID=2607834 RepID=UPI0013BE835D|nr:RNA-directed DNA polymerase [Moorena sp. SIO3H5]NEO72016.1 RNA-directed DNA polymerase [Moorena sp. SIO3H5]
MTEQPPTYRRFHPIVADAYTAVHEWLEVTVKDAHGYKAVGYKNLKNKLHKTDWKHIAFQYYALFHKHYFKAAHTLESIIGTEQIITWLRHTQKVCVLDVGCGAGAGSAAFLETVIKLKEKGDLTNEVNILFIGIDPSFRAIGLYIKMMENLQSSCSDLVNIEFKQIDKGFPSATSNIEEYLQSELLLSQLPSLSNVLVMQLNVISPFSQIYRTHQEDYDELRSLGIDIDGSSTEDNLGLGTSEALAYKHLIETVPIDVMHLVTVGTKNMEYQVQLETNSEVTLEERIKEMIRTLHQIVGNRHTIDEISSDNHIVYFENPQNCYCRDKKKEKVNNGTNFYADFQRISSANTAEDKDWNKVISLDNLNLAWARARHNLLSESLYDETELRLFETNLDSNIAKLQEQLCAYASDVALVDQTISYKFPKNVEKTRPRGLSRIEEEILSVAIIQKLGSRASRLNSVSYAYRIQDTSNEYLYTSWYDNYRNYIQGVKDSVNRNIKGLVLRIDIESYYTRIIQKKLCDELAKELRVTSKRLRWLIKVLLSNKLDNHTVGRGITQGNVGSGFYSNIYLTPIDEKFGSRPYDNEWNAEFHRFVDDMVIVIPNPSDLEDVKTIVQENLKDLGLNLNQGKTEIFDENSIPELLEQIQEDDYLNNLHNWYKCIVNPLWISNSDHRDILVDAYYDNDDLWWYCIELYQSCLKSINIYVSNIDLSRNIYKYLFNPTRRDKDLLNSKQPLNQEGELKYVKPPNKHNNGLIIQWYNQFISANTDWLDSRNDLQRELSELFCKNWNELRASDDNSGRSRKLIKYIRFALTKLSVLGFRDVIKSLIEILLTHYWIIRNPINVLENLAKQGYLAEIRSLLTHYQNLEEPVEYLKAVTIRAMRFFPKIYAQEWELIVKFATSLDSSVSIAEKLMATETWLYLGHKYNDFKQNHHIEAVKIALRSKPPERLQKNYLLILGQFEPKAVEEFQVNRNDPMLVTARNLALEGNRSDIFDLPEPKIIRKKYYSGQAPNDSDQEAY